MARQVKTKQFNLLLLDVLFGAASDDDAREVLRIYSEKRNVVISVALNWILVLLSV